MRLSRARVCWGLWASVLALAACAGTAPEAQAPAAPPAEATESAAGEEQDPQAGHDLDVGMQFDEDEEEEQPEQQVDERTPPPTRTYSPANRLGDEQQVGAEPAPDSE